MYQHIKKVCEKVIEFLFTGADKQKMMLTTIFTNGKELKQNEDYMEGES